jgi:hypothetical protein
MKIGDRVRIRTEKDFWCEHGRNWKNNISGRLGFTSEMRNHLGKEGVITERVYNGIFKVSADFGTWNWDEDWLYLISES